MFSFLKICGMGILAIILSPLWLAYFALYLVAALIIFFVTLIKQIINFFCGRHLGLDHPLDFKAREILKAYQSVPLGMAGQPIIINQQQPYQGSMGPTPNGSFMGPNNQPYNNQSYSNQPNQNQYPQNGQYYNPNDPNNQNNGGNR